MAIVGPENGGTHVPAVGASAPILAAGIAGRTELGRHVGAVRLVAGEEMGRRHGEVRVGGERRWSGGSYLYRRVIESVFRSRSWAKMCERINRVSPPEMKRLVYWSIRILSERWRLRFIRSYTLG